jgi:hypothetical protein
MSHHQLWSTQAKDFPHIKPITDQIAFICRYGAMAPSVHNTQPWEFKIKNNMLQIKLAPSRVLKVGDATTRQSWISLGACVENIVLASKCFGLKAEIDFSELSKGKHSPSIFILFTPTGKADYRPINSILSRFSDRSMYKKSPLEKSAMITLIQSNPSKLTQVKVTSDRKVIEKVAQYTAGGLGAAFSNPHFRHELANLIQINSKKPIGFTAASLRLKGIRALLEPHLVKHGLNKKRQIELEKKRICHCGGMALIFASGDTPLYWFESGRSFEAISLQAVQLGLRTSPTAAVVEAFDFHSDIEKMFNVNARLQAVLRIGVSKEKPVHTPRLPMSTVIVK